MKRNGSRAEEFDASPPGHLALERFETVDLSLPTSDPPLDDGGFDRQHTHPAFNASTMAAWRPVWNQA